MPPLIWSGAIALISAILGGAIQAATTSSREKRSFRWGLNRENYGLFLESIAGMGTSKGDEEMRLQFVRRMIEAKKKILLQGDPTVISALEKYSRHEVLASEESYEDFCELAEAMRADIGGQKMEGFRPAVRSILFQASI